jgi:hypothetical protein
MIEFASTGVGLGMMSPCTLYMLWSPLMMKWTKNP